MELSKPSVEVLEVITDYYPARKTKPDLMRELEYPCKLVDGEQPVFSFVIQKIWKLGKEVKSGEKPIRLCSIIAKACHK
jgi:hypothetical protein